MTIAQISSKYGVHATQIQSWKKRVIEEKIFHRNEAERVRLAKIQEDVRISTKKSNALMSLKMALISFGITTGIVFLFLLVRIERNLRRLLTTPS